MIGGWLAEGIGAVAGPNSRFIECGDVEVVVADGHIRNDAQIRRCSEEFPVHREFVLVDDPDKLGRKCQNLLASAHRPTGGAFDDFRQPKQRLEMVVGDIVSDEDFRFHGWMRNQARCSRIFRCPRTARMAASSSEMMWLRASRPSARKAIR